MEKILILPAQMESGYMQRIRMRSMIIQFVKQVHPGLKLAINNHFFPYIIISIFCIIK